MKRCVPILRSSDENALASEGNQADAEDARVLVTSSWKVRNASGKNLSDDDSAIMK